MNKDRKSLVNSDGSWKYTNKLENQISSYLKDHAHDPINWYPWEKEAINKAQKENKVIFLSIGYSSCYWCHIMKREVFESSQIADYINQHFIAIKIDREERPDIDDIYMTARQLIAEDGGWPNNLFLTPDLKPFYAGGTFYTKQQPSEDVFLDV